MRGVKSENQDLKDITATFNKILKGGVNNLPYITKTVGRAGCGKSSFQILIFGILFDSGISPTDICMMSHTKTGVEVLKKRAFDEFDVSIDDMKFFRTMHSMCYKLLDLKQKNQVGDEERERFMREYYPDYLNRISTYDNDCLYLSPQDKKKLAWEGKLDQLIIIDETLRNCAINDYDFGKLFSMTGIELEYKRYIIKSHKWNEKQGKYIISWNKKHGRISPREQTRFSKNWMNYLKDEHLFDFTRILEEAYNRKEQLPVNYLFSDEFQDFTYLQNKVYELWRDFGDLKMIFNAGDDAQHIFRFGGGSAQLMVDTRCDKIIKLSDTHRHGKAIFDNSQRYVNAMRVKEECDVEPLNVESEVVKCYGDEWLEQVDHFKNDDETVLVLAATDDWANHLMSKIRKLCPDVYFASLENIKIDRIFTQYNTIASLTRGEEVDWEDVEQLFKLGKTGLPTKMIYSRSISIINPTKHGNIESRLILKSVKKKIADKNFNNREFYNLKTFEKDFLRVPFNGKLLVRNIYEIELFPSALDVFPSYMPPFVNKRFGTIHKAKGDEADTVILAMAIPYPSYMNFSQEGVMDDVLHQFYVGASRAKKKLVEVYRVAKYGSGKFAPAPLDMFGG